MAYTYKFIDCNNVIIRVGYTTQSIKNRIEKYYTGNDIEKKAIQNMSSIEYVEFETEEEAYDFEGFLLRLHKPIFNVTTHTYQLHDSFNNITWIKYDECVWNPIGEPEIQAENILNYYKNQIGNNNICKMIKYKFISLRSKKNKYGKYHYKTEKRNDEIINTYDGYDNYWHYVEIDFYDYLYKNVIMENHLYLGWPDGYNSCKIIADGRILFQIKLCPDWFIFDQNIVSSLSNSYYKLKMISDISDRICKEIINISE